MYCQVNIHTSTALVQPQQILVNHHFTTNTLYLNSTLIPKGKSVAGVLQSMHYNAVKNEKAETSCRRLFLSAVIQRTHCSCSNNPCRTQKALVSCQHQSSLPEQGRDFQFLGQQWVSKAKAQGGWSCPASPSPMGLPSRPRAQTHIPAGGEGSMQPQLQEWGWGARRQFMALSA